MYAWGRCGASPAAWKEKKEKLRKQQKAPHINKGKGATWEEKPLHPKKRGVSEDQEGCGQTGQQTSPDWFEGEENAQENVWSEQAYEHSAQQGWVMRILSHFTH